MGKYTRTRDRDPDPDPSHLLWPANRFTGGGGGVGQSGGGGRAAAALWVQRRVVSPVGCASASNLLSSRQTLLPQVRASVLLSLA
ncbi:unnamed protein product [Merluccius merluccius]